MTWVIEIERTPESLRCYDALLLGKMTAIVPAIWPDEMCNVLISVERSRTITAAQAIEWIGILQDLPVEIVAPSLEESFGEIRRLAQAHRLTSYDASYLHLAIQQKSYLATRDKQLMSAARRVGVGLY